jgi:MFS transporter, SP family, galactose:H+ symporter
MTDQPARSETQNIAEQFSLATLRETPRYTYLVACIAAIGGMLFGYDIGVISGAENLLTRDFHLSSTTEEIAVAAVLFGAIIGGVIGGRLADRFSRRYTLLAMAALYAAGAILTAVSVNLTTFVVFRVLTGVAVGASSLVVPMYIAEMSPAVIRGGLVILQQLAISGGILISYVVDYAVDSAGWGWRPMFAAAFLPAAVLALGMFFISYSPRWLAMRRRWPEVEQVLDRVDPKGKAEELRLLRRSVKETEQSSWRDLLRPGLRGALVAGVGLAVLQQFVGPNTVLFYTPTIFGYAGIGGNSLLPTIYVGLALFVFVFGTIALVDVLGRKLLFYIGLTGMGSMLVLLGLAFRVGPERWGAGVLVVLLVYVAFYSLSISPLFWLMTAELFPNRLRGVGASISSTSNWTANLLISITFLTLIDVLGKSWTFWLYAIFAALGVLFVARFVPETKGRPLEHIEEYWTNGRRWPAPTSGSGANGTLGQ